MSATKPDRVPLDRGTIVHAAVALADEVGVGTLSMRNLAARMGYGVMSLYNHVANKDELLTLMVDSVASEITDAPPGRPPLEAVRAIAVSTRQMFVTHPWAPALWLRHSPGPARTRGMEELLRLFAESGLASELAHHGFHAVNNHVLGYTLQEFGMDLGGDDLLARAREFLAEVDTGEYPHAAAHIREHLDGNTTSSFELVLDLILDGLVRLDQSR